VDIVVKGRHIEVSDRFREHVKDKLDKVERLDPKVMRADVEVTKEPNLRLTDQAFRVEITCRSRGPVIRAEANADDKYGALDIAWARLEYRLRKAADRRRDHHRRTIAAPSVTDFPSALFNGSAPTEEYPEGAAMQIAGDGPMVVREKTHEASPMTLDQALYEMELVGHDFYLFMDAKTLQPSVVYRRRGYDYGVMHLLLSEAM